MLKDCAEDLGRTPVKREFPQWRELKRCFGSWEKALKAAGLESANSSKQHFLRAKQRKVKKLSIKKEQVKNEEN